MCRRRPAAAPAAQPVVPGAEGAEEAAKPAAAAASAEEAAGALSRASFWWVVPFFRAACAEVAASGELSLESLPPVPQAEAPSAVIARLGGLVEEELRAKRPSMHRAVWRFCRGTLVQQVLVCVVYTLLSMASPALVRPLMQAIRGEISRDYGFAAVLAMTASGIVSAVLQQLSFHAFTRLGRQVWLAFVGHLFEKPARLDAATFSHSFTEGQVISMIGQDAPQFPYMAPFFSIFISAPLMIMVGGALIFAFLKEAFLSGCVVCTLAMFISERASAKYKAIVAQKLLAADERMLLVNEALQGMRYIKLCAWESSIEERVAEVRVREMRLLRRAHMCYAFQQTVVASLPVLATVATLVTHAALGRAFETGDVLMALGCFELMATGFLILPNAFMYTKTFHVSIARMGRLVAHAETYAPRPRAGPEPGLALEDASFQWDLAAGEPSLAGVSLRVGRGRLVAVVGRVAAGKTTLASGALGLARRTSGKARLCGRCAYVPQSPQILNATLRDNVLFGAEPDEERYLRALRSCCLERDVAQFADRDLTEIGERGITISGGQRARVALARALFSNPDVVILDDPLSAMDPHVGRTVFQECILKDMRGRGCAVLFLTNQLQFCQAADSILVLDRGRVVEEGSFEELRDAGGVFTELFATAASTSEACKAAQAPQSGTSPGGLPDGCWCLAMPRLRACRGAGIARGKDADAAESAARSVPLDNGQEIHGGPELAATPATPGLKKTWSMSQEAIIRGRIGVREFLLIARTGDSSCLGTLLLAFCILAPLFMYGTSLSLSRWITAGGSEPLSRRGELQLYLAAGGLYAASSGGRTVSAALYFTRVAEKLHARMMGAVLRQTMAWYDTTPMGRVLNRCSQDLALLDLQLPRLFEFTMQHTGGLVVGFVGTALLVWPSLLVILPLSWAVWELFRKYGTVSLDLQRLMLVCTSPVMSRVSSFLTALDTIRAFGKEGFFEADFRRSLSDFVRVYYWIHAVDRLVMISAALLCIPALTLLLGAGTLLLSGAGVVSGDLGGLALALSCGLSLRFPLWIWCASTTEKFLGGAQRVREYAELPWEGGPRDRAAWAAGGPGPAAGAAPAGAAEAEAWPARGTLELEDVHVRYQAGLPLVLRGLSLKVRPGERVGVCGRTGSGKSTLFLACFRMAELERGRLLVEGRDAREVPLPVLRARLAIVPQDPLMFSGTLRSNLDLRGRFADAAVWEALRLACLEDQVRGLARGLDEPVQEKGGNFSAGTVQLLCIARILLNSSAVGLLFLDECTASVDYETDALVQAAVRRAFSGCSIICIAHRIQTILDYDKIAFLDAGQLAEYGSPQELLRKPGGLFADLARGTRDGGQHSAKSGLQQAM